MRAHYKIKIIVTMLINMAVVTSVQAQAEEIPWENIILQLSFDDNQLTDLSIHNHEVVNHQTTFTTGVNREGLKLEGQNNYIEIPFVNTIQIPEQVSISLWYLHENQDGSGFYSLVEQSADEFGGHSRYGTWVFNQNEVMACVEPDQCPDGRNLCQRCIISTSSLEEGKWYHIVSTYDGSTQKLYINGQLNSAENYDQSTGISVREYPLTIGTDIYDNSPLYLKGSLDEILLMNIALTEQQVEILFQEFTTTSVIEDLVSQKIEIFPNPVNHFVNIKTQAVIENIKIYDVYGQLVKEVNENVGSKVFLGDLNEGLYFINLNHKNQRLSKKLLISRH